MTYLILLTTRVLISFFFLASLASMTYGFLAAWPSPFIVKITQDKENYDISEDQASVFTLIPPLTMVIFALLFSKMNDIFGRKRGLMLLVIPYIISLLLTAHVCTIYGFYVARFISGLGDACHFVTVPMYVGEISSPKVRGKFGNLVSGFIFFGQFLINLIGQNFSVTQSAYICLSVPILFLILVNFLPESPYYCIMKQKENEAKTALYQLRRKKARDLIEEYQQLKMDVSRQMSERGTWPDLVLIKSNRKALMGGIFLRFSQQFAGASMFSSYVHFIFEKAGTQISSKLSTLIITSVLSFSIFVVGFLVESFGRKKCFTFSLFTCACLLLLEGAFFYVDQNTEIDVKFINWLPLAISLLIIVFSALGITIIPTLMLGELFSANIKAYGLSIVILSFGVFIFASNAIFYFLISHYGLSAPFWFFGVISIFNSFIAKLIIPETRGKTLEQIQQDLKKTTDLEL